MWYNIPNHIRSAAKFVAFPVSNVIINKYCGEFGLLKPFAVFVFFWTLIYLQNLNTSGGVL